MHIAITGSTGLIGSALRDVLVATGHRVSQLVRRASVAPEEIGWDPLRGSIEEERLGGVDAVIHLAGASIGQRWTKAHMSNIRKSRVVGTRHLADALANSRSGPKTLICSSAIGYYGAHRGDELLTERSAAGDGFLAEVVQAWEAAADPARQAGLRVVHIRTGVVQSSGGGILKLQLPLFKLGLGGRVGSGRQWLSWISLDDIVDIFRHALITPGLEGVINGVAPNPVSNLEYSKTLARVLNRPAILPVPNFAPALLLGRQGAEETALASQRVIPERLLKSGYVFQHPELATAFRELLGKWNQSKKSSD